MQRPPLETLYVDLGLPSGNRWAVSNLDVNGPYYFQESPYQYECSFFSWGNTTPHNPDSENKFDYNFSIDYPNSPGAALTGDIPLSHDAARVLLGSPWRLPSVSEFRELLASCIYIDVDGNEIPVDILDKNTIVGGVYGLYLQSRYNGRRIFIPCCGYGSSANLVAKSQNVFYWTAGYYSASASYCLRRHSSGASNVYTGSRNNGANIRPVWNPRDLR